MGRIQNFVCDGCGAILLGQDRAAKVSKDYMSIKGQITLQLAHDPLNPGHRTFIYLSDRDVPEYSFCNPGCIQAFIDVSRAVGENRRKAYLEKQAKLEAEGAVTGHTDYSPSGGTIRKYHSGVKHFD